MESMDKMIVLLNYQILSIVKFQSNVKIFKLNVLVSMYWKSIEEEKDYENENHKLPENFTLIKVTSSSNNINILSFIKILK